MNTPNSKSASAADMFAYHEHMWREYGDSNYHLEAMGMWAAAAQIDLLKEIQAELINLRMLLKVRDATN